MEIKCPSCGADMKLQILSATNMYICAGCGKQLPAVLSTQVPPSSLPPYPQIPNAPSNIPPHPPADQNLLKLPPPLAPDKASPAVFKPVFEYKSPSTRSILAITFISISILSAIGVIWALNLRIDLLTGVKTGQHITHDEAVINDARVQMMTLINVACNITFTIFYFIWVYRVYMNLSPLQASQIRFTPGWAVGYHFIPVVNIWKPCQALVDVWRGSDKASLGNKFVNNSGLVILWWVAHLLIIVSQYLNSFDISKAIKEKNIEKMISTSFTYNANQIWSIFISMLLIVVILVIWKRQEKRYEAIRLQEKNFASAMSTVAPMDQKGIS